jgi:predicted dienelactone hydrolase
LPEEIVYDVGVGDLVPPLNAWEGRALLDAAPDLANGPYPLILSSHGHQGTFHHTVYIHEHLASYGFVVMAMWHPGNTLRDSLLVQNQVQQSAFIEAFIDSLVLRPQDVRQTLDYAEVLAADALIGLIDLERVGVMGLSYGGYTALAAVGSRLDFSGLADLCAVGAQASILTTLMCQIHGADLAGVEMRLMELAGGCAD